MNFAYTYTCPCSWTPWPAPALQLLAIPVCRLLPPPTGPTSCSGRQTARTPCADLHITPRIDPRFSRRESQPNPGPELERELEILRRRIIAQPPMCIRERTNSASVLAGELELHENPFAAGPFQPSLYSDEPRTAARAAEWTSVRSNPKRLERIRKYKESLRKWREKHPISRCFAGRRRTAMRRLRTNGRFATGDEDDAEVGHRTVC